MAGLIGIRCDDSHRGRARTHRASGEVDTQSAVVMSIETVPGAGGHVVWPSVSSTTSAEPL